MATPAQFYKAIVKSSNDAIISKSLDGIITSWNAAAEAIFGYSAQEMLGQSVLRLFPDDRIDEEQHILKAIKQGKSVEHYKTQRLDKAGQLLDILVTVSPILDDNGDIVGASKIVKDISQQVRTESILKRYAAIVSFSDDAIVSYNLEGRIVGTNQAVTRLTGYSEEQLVGSEVMSLFCKSEAHHYRKLVEAIIDGQPIEHFRSKLRDNREHSIAVSVAVSPIPDEHDSVSGGAIFVRDIRRVIKSEQQLAHYQALVESSEDAIISKSLNCLITSWNKAA